MSKKSLTGIILAIIMLATAYLAFTALAGADKDPFGVAFDEDM